MYSVYLQRLLLASFLICLTPAVTAQPRVESLGPAGNIPSLNPKWVPQAVPINTNRLEGLSQRWAQNQYRLYQLSVHALNRLKPGQDQPLALQLFNRQWLLYRSLEMLGGQGRPRFDSPVLRLMNESSQELPRWREEIQTAAAELSQGWVIWEYNVLTQQAQVLSLRDSSEARFGAVPLVVIDLHTPQSSEGFGNRSAYVQAVLNNLSWEKIERELARWGVL